MTTNDVNPSTPDPLVISKREQTKSEEMFQKLSTDGYLAGKRAVVLLGKSGLPQQTLARVWALADSDADGRLSMKVRFHRNTAMRLTLQQQSL